jgi:hypothetical protein
VAFLPASAANRMVTFVMVTFVMVTFVMVTCMGERGGGTP